MTVHLLDEAIISQAGIYEVNQIDLDTFVELVWEAGEAGNLKNYICKKDRPEIIQTVCRINLKDMRVDQTGLKDGDKLLIAKPLKGITLADRAVMKRRGEQLTIEDFEFSVAFILKRNWGCQHFTHKIIPITNNTPKKLKKVIGTNVSTTESFQ